MHPILFELGPCKIYSYGLMVAVAFIIGAYLASLEARREHIDADKILNLCLGLVISGILGARTLYILQNLSFYLGRPQQILLLHRGGLSFYGGFVCATIFAILFLRRQHLPIFKVLDIISPYLALAQAVGRIGCFLNGCCYGKTTDSFFAVYFPGENFNRHPVQIYSSLGLLLIFAILRIRQNKKERTASFSGQIFLLYCLLYSTLRFLLEFLRADNLRIFANLTVHQLISIGIFVTAAIIWKSSLSRLTR